MSSKRDAWNVEARSYGQDEDTVSVVSSARSAFNAITGSDDEDDYADGDDGLSVARSANTNTNTNTNTSSGRSRNGSSRNGSNSNSGSTPPASVISNARVGKGRPPTRQSGWDVRSTASSIPSVPESVEPTESGFSSRAPSVSAAGGSDNGSRRSGTRPATRSDGRSSVSSSSVRGAPPASSITASSSVGSGFPTFADTHWGDPIAMAMADAAKEGKRDRGRQDDGSAGEEGPGPRGGSKMSKSARRRKNKAKSALVQAQAAQVDVLEQAVLDVELPPGGPGSSWGDPNEAW